MSDVKHARCLYCHDAADSPEHIIPAGIGGILRPPIACARHNAVLNTNCDVPLVKQMQYLVHSLKVQRDRRGTGTTVKMSDADGHPYIVNAKHQPAPGGSAVIERGGNGKPTKLRVRNAEQGTKILASMGLSPEHPDVSIEHITEVAPALQMQIQVGGPDGLRGILKIAYEFVRGHQGASAADRDLDQQIRDVLLNAKDPSLFVRWLPFENLATFDADQAPYFSHRIIAWQDETHVLVVVELFNVYSFLVRLPGLRLAEAVVFNQGLHGDRVMFSRPSSQANWGWDEVPLHAQPLMLPGIGERVGAILESMTTSSLLQTLSECVEFAFRNAAPSIPEDIVVHQAAERAKALLSTEYSKEIDVLRPFMRSLVIVARELATLKE